MRAFPTLAALAVLTLLAACGTKGELVKPPGPPPKPILDEWVAAPATPAKDSKPAQAADKQ